MKKVVFSLVYKILEYEFYEYFFKLDLFFAYDFYRFENKPFLPLLAHSNEWTNDFSVVVDLFLRTITNLSMVRNFKKINKRFPYFL